MNLKSVQSWPFFPQNKFCSTASSRVPSGRFSFPAPNKCFPISLCHRQQALLRLPRSNSGVFFISLILCTCQGIAIPSRLITSSFFLSPFGISELLIISLPLWTVMRLWLPTGEHHPTLMSIQTETLTWIPSHGSTVQARWDVSICRQTSAGELEFAGWLLCSHFGLMIHIDSKQLSSVVILIYILAITSLIIMLHCFILPCPLPHLCEGFLELCILKRED